LWLRVREAAVALGAGEDGVGADSAPDDVRLACDAGVAVLEGRSSIIGPGHFEDAGCRFHALDPEPVPEPGGVLEVLDELTDGDEKRGLLSRRQAVEICAEARQPGEGRQRKLRRRTAFAALGASAEGIEELALGAEGLDPPRVAIGLGLALARLPFR
jgi:hypothetical protein